MQSRALHSHQHQVSKKTINTQNKPNEAMSPNSVNLLKAKQQLRDQLVYSSQLNVMNALKTGFSQQKPISSKLNIRSNGSENVKSLEKSNEIQKLKEVVPNKSRQKLNPKASILSILTSLEEEYLSKIDSQRKQKSTIIELSPSSISNFGSFAQQPSGIKRRSFQVSNKKEMKIEENLKKEITKSSNSNGSVCNENENSTNKKQNQQHHRIFSATTKNNNFFKEINTPTNNNSNIPQNQAISLYFQSKPSIQNTLPSSKGFQSFKKTRSSKTEHDQQQSLFSLISPAQLPQNYIQNCVSNSFSSVLSIQALLPSNSHKNLNKNNFQLPPNDPISPKKGDIHSCIQNHITPRQQLQGEPKFNFPISQHSLRDSSSPTCSFHATHNIKLFSKKHKDCQTLFNPLEQNNTVEYKPQYSPYMNNQDIVITKLTPYKEIYKPISSANIVHTEKLKSNKKEIIPYSIYFKEDQNEDEDQQVLLKDSNQEKNSNETIKPESTQIQRKSFILPSFLQLKNNKVRKSITKHKTEESTMKQPSKSQEANQSQNMPNKQTSTFFPPQEKSFDNEDEDLYNYTQTIKCSSTPKKQ